MHAQIAIMWHALPALPILSCIATAWFAHRLYFSGGLQDDLGVGYVAYSSEDNKVMHISPLTPDFTNVQGVYNPVFAGLKREAPAMFKFRNVFLLATSGCTGWEPNELQVYWAL